MIAVIFGLVAVVLLVLVVVALGMRSMNRRESNLPPERLRKMAEQADDPNAKRPGRPAEETFFESFPEGFDAFQEPERATARLRPGNGRPASRPAGRPGGRPAPRGKQAASNRGRRGVDEWGEADDYDDDYWSRVRADDGAFGGTIAARMGQSRPDVSSPSNSVPSPAKAASPKDAKDAKEKEGVDANAATVQAPLPTRPAGLADLVEPSRNTTPSAAAASERTVTFSAPIPQTPAADVLGAIGTPQPSSRSRRGSRPDPADPLGVADSRAKPRRRSDAGNDPARTAPGRGADSRRTDTRRGSGRNAEPGRADTGRAATPARPDPVRADASRAVTGPFNAGRPAAGASHDPLSGPLNTGPLAAAPHPTGSLANDPLTSGALSSGALSGGPAPKSPRSGGSRPAGPLDSSHGATGPFDAGRSSTGSYETPRATGGSRGSGSFPPAASYDPLGTGPAAPGATGDFPAGGSWPAQPAYPAAGSYDILDEPTPASGSSKETWKTADYQLPTYDGYASRDGYTAAPSAPSPSPAPSYEVRPGWATIDDSDSVNGTTPAAGLPTGPSRAVSAYETPTGRDLPSSGDDSPAGSGQGYGGYDAERYATPGAPSPAWPQPAQNTGGSWPSYGELYGSGANGGLGADQPTQTTQSTQSSQASPSRGGHRRPADTDYPDYYR
ncbi:hypothetical protein AB0O34_09845 [Sphaerisporangium sp. NPDC088356]|uniref:hypothetical protein n=1 Tax=Sphaerisporangium sp. NPDC088356 TaxID=3154871 RepID=UPI003423FB50